MTRKQLQKQNKKKPSHSSDTRSMNIQIIHSRRLYSQNFDMCHTLRTHYLHEKWIQYNSNESPLRHINRTNGWNKERALE